MPSMLICNGIVDPVSLTCDTGWVVSDHPVYEPLSTEDYLELQGLILALFMLSYGLKLLRGVFENNPSRY